MEDVAEGFEDFGALFADGFADCFGDAGKSFFFKGGCQFLKCWNDGFGGEVGDFVERGEQGAAGGFGDFAHGDFEAFESAGGCVGRGFGGAFEF